MSGLGQTLLEWCTWVEATPLAVAIGESSYYFPWLETIHVAALGLVLGTIAIVDLRLLGLASRIRPVRDVIAETLPFTWGGFVLALVSGSLMFISRATIYFANVPFRIKLGLLALAGLNMVVFHVLTMRSLDGWNESERTPTGARVAGASSMLLWIGIVFAGRWIAFTE
jgi:hypothetical protein